MTDRFATTGTQAAVTFDAQRVRRLLEEGLQRAQRARRPIVVSTAAPTLRCDPLAFFARGAQVATDRLFWARPTGSCTMAAVGAAWTVSVSGTHRFAAATADWRGRLADALSDAPPGLPGVGPVLMGGFAFDPLRPTTALWDSYPGGLLVLPRYLLTVAGDTTWLTVNTVLWPDDDVETAHAAAVRTPLTLLAGAVAEGLPEGQDPLVAERQASAAATVRAEGTGDVQDLCSEDVMPPGAWQAVVQALREHVRRGDVEKVVLARACSVRGRAPFDPASILRRLRADYPTCTIFAVARGDRCFLGATPELLVRLRGRTVWTMCLAGSTARGATEDDDRRLGEALLASAKEQTEHAIVVRAVCAALAEVCDEVWPAAAPTLLRVRNVQHLCTPVVGHAAAGLTILELLEHLHPTPAVGGYPRARALQLIREYERFDRGWYAGPVGWLDARGEGEFAVAIRSALLQGPKATLYAGCGIVADSDPAREYAESRLKLVPMLTALAGQTV